MLTIALVVLVLITAGLFYMMWKQQSKLPSYGKVPDFTLQNINGSTFNFQESNGKVRLVYLFFSSCTDVCPITTHQMSKIQNKLKEKGLFGNEVQFISISVDPKRDTTEVLKNYGDKFGVDWSGWIFLRGEEEKQLEKVSLGFQSGLVKLNEEEFMHSDSLILVDKEGNIRDMDLEHDIDKMTKEILTLVKE
ncbi:SCO family protein [Paenibacillus sp. PvR148]